MVQLKGGTWRGKVGWRVQIVLHRNLGDLSSRMSGQESDGAVVASKRVTTVERRAPALKEQIKPRGGLIDGNIYDRGAA